MTYQSSTAFQMPELYFTTLFEALPGSCILLQNNTPLYTVLAATPEYLTQTGYRKEVIIGKGVFEMSPANPDNPTDSGASDLEKSLEHVRLHKEPHQLPVQRYDIAGENGSYSERYWRASNKPVFSPDGEVAYIIHTADDITKKVKTREREVQLEGIEKAFDLFMHAPIVVGLVNGDDYVLEIANEAAFKLWGKGSEIIGKPILQELPELEGQGIIELFNQIRTSGQPYIAHEVPVTSIVNGGEEQHYFNLVYQPYYSNGSKATGVFTILHEVTEQVKARRKAQESEESYRTLFESMDQGYCTLQILFEGEKCVDYRYLETNPTFERHLGMTNALGKTIREIAPDIEPKWFDFYGGVALTGNPIRIEEESKAFNKWFEVYAVRVGSAEERKVGVFFTDITERKNSELLLKNNQELLQTVFDASPNSLTVYEEVYDSEGQIEDFKFVVVNEFTIKTTGREDLIGKRYSVEFPNVLETGVMEIFKNVAITGVPADFEKWYQGEGMRHWFRFIVNKVGKLLVVTTEDITKRKEAEKALQDSEVKFRTMAESTPVPITVGDETGKVIYFNKAWTHLTGKAVQDLLLLGWVNLIYEEDRERFSSVFLDAFANEGPFTGEFRVLNAAGQPRWLLADAVPRFDTEGNFMGYISACTDITESKISHQQLQTALEQARLSKEAAELGTFDLDLEKGTMHWDDRCRILFGISHHEPVTYEGDFLKGLHPNDHNRVVEVIRRSYNRSLSNGDYDVEYRTIGAEDGIVRWVRAKGKVYFDVQEKPVRFIGSVLDITEQVMAIQKIEGLVEERTKELAQANESLMLANKELQRSNANLEEFTSAASHDLKEPIRKITIFSNQLKAQLASRLKENEVRLFGRIQNASERMGNLIDDLLLYSHVTQRPHETETIDLNQKVQRVLEDLELDIEEKNAIIGVAKLPVVKGYRRQLQQLFQNLISNALKYSKTDVAPQIDISATEVTESGKRYYAITVKDNGIGFEEQHADKIFQMFTRLHGKAEYSGTGVGLSIVKKVVENHNGIIRVESAPEVGSIFMILLPAE